MRLLTQLSEETASKNAVIPYVLRRGCRAYPDMESLAGALDELYGADLIPLVAAKGEVQTVGLLAAFVDDRFLPDEDRLTEKVIGLVGEVLLDPATRGGLLHAEYVKSERDKLCDRIRAQMNDKRTYAVERLKALMCPDEAYRVGQLGTVKTAERIGQRMLTTHYRHLLESSPMELFYCGSKRSERVIAMVLEAFKTLPRGELDEEPGTEIRIQVAAPRFFTEEMDVTQGKLAMGFRLGESMYTPDYAALNVFNAVFGGGVTSKLFVHVRERLSLCYYASSSINLYKGVLLVSSGIEFANYERTRDEILRQLEACGRGEISDAELENAKLALVSAYRTVGDSQLELENFYLGQTLLKLDLSPEDYARLVPEVTIEQVQQAAARVRLDTVYFLRGE